MRFWRIAHPRYALDKSCAGTALFGGRWNPVGMPVLYCSAYISLCALEKFVHLGSSIAPPMLLVAVDVPDDIPLERPEIDSLPLGWNALPVSDSAQKFGASWLAACSAMAMQLPSALIPEEANVIINPQHPQYSRVALTTVREFRFDARMYKN